MSFESYRVLLVEDDQIDRMAFERFVKQEDLPYDYRSVGCFAEARDALSEEGFDVVLADYALGDGTALDVLALVKGAPVVVITGSGNEEIAVQSLKNGAYDYIVKDPNGSYLMMLPVTVERVIERWQAQRELEDYRGRLEELVQQRTAALMKSQKQLQTVVEATPTILFSLDADGVLTFVSGKPLDDMGYDPDQLLGRSVFDMFHVDAPDDAPRIAESVRHVLAGESARFEIGLRGRWFQVSAEPLVEDDTVTGVIGVLHDVTEMQETTFQLANERNLLRTLIDNVPDYVFVKDRDGMITVTNVSHAEGAGVSPEAMIGKKASELYEHMLADQFEADDQKVMASGQPLINQERSTRDAQGHQRWVLTSKIPLHDDAGQVDGLVGISRDITRWRAAEVARRATDERLRTVVSHVPLILFEVNADGVFELVTGQGVHELGLSSEKLINTSIYDVADGVEAAFRAQLRDAWEATDLARVVRLDSKYLEFRYTRRPYGRTDEGTNRTGMIGVALDVTERINAEEQRVRAENLRSELEREREISALKERFLATATHDFRTPLTIIKSSAHLIRDYADRLSPERSRAKVEQIIAQVEHMTTLLDDVLSISRANAGQVAANLQTVDLETFCRRVWDDFLDYDDGSHDLRFQYNASSLQVKVDQLLLQQVLVNLLANAVKYTSEGGTVTLQVDVTEDAVQFHVTDSGIGVPEDDKARLFEPFHRAANVRQTEGTGLGLSIAHSYVELHNGHIELNSQEGRGSTFTVHIPLESATSTEPEQGAV